jgi:hypothetical protein
MATLGSVGLTVAASVGKSGEGGRFLARVERDDGGGDIKRLQAEIPDDTESYIALVM